MNALKKLAISLTAILSGSTAICGFSIAQSATIEQSSIDFHMGIAILTMLATFGTIALLARNNK